MRAYQILKGGNAGSRNRKETHQESKWVIVALIARRKKNNTGRKTKFQMGTSQMEEENLSKVKGATGN